MSGFCSSVSLKSGAYSPEVQGVQRQIVLFSTLTDDAIFSCTIGSTELVQHKRARPFPSYSESYGAAES